MVQRAKSSPALLVSVLLHAGALGLLFVAWPKEELPSPPDSVPVSIISSEIVEAAAPDNPSEELVTEDGATAPVETPPEPVMRPTPPAPTPPPPAPRPSPTPQPRPPEKARPTPPRPNPPAPAPKQRQQPSLDLDALAGPPRPRPNTGRPATGQQGAGQASQATGPQLQALGRQVIPNWNVRAVCDLPGGDELTIRVRVRIGTDGRIIGSPNVESGGSGAAGRAATDSIVQALRATSPFDLPDGFTAQEVPFRFETATVCRRR